MPESKPLKDKPVAEAIRELADTLNNEMYEDEKVELTTTHRHIYHITLLLARVVESGKLDIYAVFGTPGDWGYSSPFGKVLNDYYKKNGV